MKTIRVRKRFILVILCTIFFTLLCAPIYSHYLLIGLWQSRYDNKTARVDIVNTKDNTNTIKIIRFQAPSHKQVDFPQWCAQNNGNCAMLNATVASSWREFKVKFKVVGDGKITLNLRAPDVREDRIRYPVLVDYRFVTVDGKPILRGRKTFWHDKPLQYSLEAKDEQVVELKFQVRKHHLRWSDGKYYAMNWLLFISVLILSFLLSYKLVQYVSKFKLLEHNSRIDIVFVIVFLMLLCVPMSHISTAEKSEQENRMLAKYFPLLVTGGVNYNYGRQFEQWFNDRFFGRSLLIDLYSILHRELNNIYKNGGAIWIKNNNWIYKEWDIKQKKFEENKTVAIIKQINLLNEFCRENNIRMYMLIVPSKESIYARFLPMEYQKIIKHNQFNQYINSLISSLDVPTVFPYDELHQASYKDFVFFKQSHHWTDWGAYTGYLALMEVIKKDYPNIHISTLDEYNISTSKLLREDWGREYGIGQTTRLLYIDQKYAHKNLLKDNYTYYDHKNEIKPIVTEADFYKTKYFKNPQQAKAPRVLLTGTSMNEDFLQFLPYSFSEIKYYRLNNVLKVQGSETFKLLKRYKKDILDYNPNILILCVTSGNVLQLDELTKE